MSTITTIKCGGDYEVWIALEGEEPPHGCSFIIGLGETEDEARAAAVKDLEACLEQLQQPTTP
jgi:hypothetical protein